LQKYVKLRTPAERADELWRAIDVAYHRREQARETRMLAELLMERFATQHRHTDRRPQAYVWHARLLEERQQWDEAVAVMTGAITLGINDRTARGFAGRLESLQRKASGPLDPRQRAPPRLHATDTLQNSARTISGPRRISQRPWRSEGR
jgi:hypothetical protein